MVSRPRRPLSPEEEENRRQRKAELKRLERERKRRREDDEKEASEQEVRRRHREQLRDQNATYQRNRLQRRQSNSRNALPETLSAVSPDNVENDGRVPPSASAVEADVPPQEPQDVPPSHFQSIDRTPPVHHGVNPVTLASPTARRLPPPQEPHLDPDTTVCTLLIAFSNRITA